MRTPPTERSSPAVLPHEEPEAAPVGGERHAPANTLAPLVATGLVGLGSLGATALVWRWWPPTFGCVDLTADSFFWARLASCGVVPVFAVAVTAACLGRGEEDGRALRSITAGLAFSAVLAVIGLTTIPTFLHTARPIGGTLLYWVAAAISGALIGDALRHRRSSDTVGLLAATALASACSAWPAGLVAWAHSGEGLAASALCGGAAAAVVAGGSWRATLAALLACGVATFALGTGRISDPFEAAAYCVLWALSCWLSRRLVVKWMARESVVPAVSCPSGG